MDLFKAFDNWTQSVQRDTDAEIKRAQQALEGGTNEFIGHWQNVGKDTADLIGGKGFTEGIGDQGLPAAVAAKAAEVQGDMMGAGVGNIANAFNVDPKILLLVGAGVVALIILMKIGG